MTTGVTPFPAAHLPGLSAYSGSKLAQAKVLEFVAAEHSNIFCANVHPGMVENDTFYKTGATPDKLLVDKGEKLPWIPYFVVEHQISNAVSCLG